MTGLTQISHNHLNQISFENLQVGSARWPIPDFFCGPISKSALFKETRAINVACDSISDRGCAVLQPNQSYQEFVKVADFETTGKFNFSIMMRT